MTSVFEDTRVSLLALVKDFHNTEATGLEVNYPGRWVTDVDNNDSQFISIELTMKSKPMELPQRNVLRVSGRLILNHYVRDGSGSKVLAQYSDKVFNYFSLRTVSGITFMELIPYSNVGKPGFYGTMNSLEFYKDYFNV